jgi:hypothetical protein
MAVRCLEPWALEELVGRSDALTTGGAAGVLRPQYLPLAVEALEARGWRVPSEDEWEFAIRAGTRSLFADGGDAIPELPVFAVNPLGLLNCAESAEVVRSRDGRYLQRGGCALYFPWQGPNWMWSMCGVPSQPIEEFFASFRPVVSLPFVRSSELRPAWSRRVVREAERVFAPGPTLPDGLPALLTERIALDTSELDVRQLLVLDDDGARLFARRLEPTLAFFEPDRREQGLRQLLALIGHRGTKERGRLLSWFARELSTSPDAVELWQFEMTAFRNDSDQSVRAAAAWVLEPQLLRDDGPTVALTVALSTVRNERYASLRAQLAAHADPLVRATAGVDVHEALASASLPVDFPFPARVWFEQLLKLADEPIEPSLERRVARPCSTHVDRELRDLAAARLVSRNFKFLAHDTLKTLSPRQTEILELLRAHGACVRLYEHGVSLF